MPIKYRWEYLRKGKGLEEFLDDFEGVPREEAAAASFAVLLTVDQNICYQPNLTGRPIAVLIMIAGGITVEDLRPLVPAVEKTLASVAPGQLYEVTVEH